MIELTMFQWFLIYIAGAAVTCGITGGVRDEMDGIVDMFFILFWPLCLAIIIGGTPIWLLYRTGRMIRMLKERK